MLDNNFILFDNFYNESLLDDFRRKYNILYMIQLVIIKSLNNN